MAPPINGLMAAPILVQDGTSGANAILTVTIAAPTDAVRNTIAVFGFRVSESAAAVVTGAILLKQAAVTVVTVQLTATVTPNPLTYDFPANHPYVAPAGAAVTLTVPALGGTTISSAQLLYMIVPV